jgi:hypothetical protein
MDTADAVSVPPHSSPSSSPSTSPPPNSSSRSVGLALFRSAGDVGFVFAPLILGAAADVYGLAVTMQSLGGAVLMTGAVVQLFGKRRQK